MSWLDLTTNAAKVLLWRTRLNRMQFGVGYIALCFLGAVVMNLVFFAIAASVGSLEEVFDHPEWIAPGFVLLVFAAWALIANRAHDLGWPGWPFVLLYLVPVGPWLVVMDGASGFLGGATSGLAQRVHPELLYALIFIPAFLINVSLITLAVMRGQNGSNRFGEPPLPGLWNNVPSRSQAGGD